jgi:putative endonuclease
MKPSFKHTLPKNKTRQKSRMFGVRAESLAALLLMCKGYRILERNYLSGGGEIDLIAQRGRVVAFVEVKARPTQGAALISIDDRKLQRIAKAARNWVNRSYEPQNLILRFDAVLIAPRKFPRHMQNIAELPYVY